MVFLGLLVEEKHKNSPSKHNDIPSGINPSGQQQFIYISAPSPAKMGHSLLQAVK